jgi:phosphoribosylformylglycinamidine synthase PurS subunit
MGAQKVQVLVRLKPGVLDVQGKAVEGVAHRLGFEQVTNVRVGRLIEFEVPSGTDASTVADRLAATMLGNPVIETTEVVLGKGK